MPKLALSRRHRRQNNLAGCWNASGPTPFPSLSDGAGDCCPSFLSSLVPAEAAGSLFGRTTPRMVSDEDMRQAASSREKGGARPCSGGQPCSPILAHNRQHSLKRPKPSSGGCLVDLTVSSPPLQRARPSSILSPLAGAPRYSSESSSISTSRFLPAVVSPCSPWGHFVDLLSQHDQDDDSPDGCDSEHRGVAHLAGVSGLANGPDVTSPRPTLGAPSVRRFLPNCPAPLVRPTPDRDSPYYAPSSSLFSSSLSALARRKRPMLRGSGPVISGRWCVAGSVRTMTGPPSAAMTPCSLRGFVLNLPGTGTAEAPERLAEEAAGHWRNRSPDCGDVAGLCRRPEADDEGDDRQQQMRLLEEAQVQFGNLRM